MSMYNSKELDAKETCPYNVSHRIMANKFTKHLVKCRKANPNIEKVTCPFYAEHKVPKPELAYHMETCPKKKDFDKQVFQEETEPTTFEVEGGIIQTECEETWDTHDNPTYNPTAYCEQNRIIRQTKVESASIRRNFRIGERQRHQMLERQEQERTARAPERFKHETEDSTRYDSSSTALTSISEQLSQLSVDDEAPKMGNNNAWTKIVAKRGRGRGKHT